MLFKEYVRILKESKPKGFLFENVYRIVGAQGGRPWMQIQSEFKKAGYTLFWRIVDAADYGVPQNRERLIIVGLRDKGTFLFPYPTHGPDSPDNRPYYTAGNAVSGLSAENGVPKINGRHGHLLNAIPPGLNYSYYTQRMGHPMPIFGWRSKFSDYLYKADPQTPVRTIKAQGGQYTGPFSWENRPFTLGELKRLQTFPDRYDLLGNRQVAIHQLGNSVPTQLGRILALAILDQVFQVKLKFDVKYLSASQSLGFRKRKADLTRVYAEKASEGIRALGLGVGSKLYRAEKRTESLNLLANFELTKKEDGSGIRYDFDYELTKSQWAIKMSNKVKVSRKAPIKSCFSVFIELNKEQQLEVGTEKIIMDSSDSDPRALLALWKFLEKLLRKRAHKDDLIQLFGYYQSRMATSFGMRFSKKTMANDDFWSVAAKVTQGAAVGKVLHLEEFSELFSLSQDSILATLKALKKIGFEIRSNNTNLQMKKNYYLIPYAFPTLNERSLQRFKAL
jgi:DNA (cytosine-5)-methyltransferase 1